MEQFEIVNTLGLDLDSFELQSYLDPKKKINQYYETINLLKNDNFKNVLELSMVWYG